MGRANLWRDPRFRQFERRHPAFASYCSHLKRRNVAARTIETYSDCLLTFARWLDETGNQDPCKVGPADLEEFRVWLVNEYEREVSPRRQGTYVAVLRSFYRFLHAERLVLADPSKGLRYPKIKKRIHRDILTPQELCAAIGKPDDSPTGLRDRVALRLLALSGPRVSELADVDVADVAVQEREMIIRKGKGSKERLVFFDRETQGHLARYLLQGRPRLARADERALIVADRGDRISPYELRSLLRRCMKAARVRKHVTPHSMRRTFCTLLLRGGANLKVIAELAGHASLSTTAKYTKIDIRELAAVYRAAHPRSGA